MKLKNLVYFHKEIFSHEQKKFIKESFNDSFSKLKILFFSKRIEIRNFKKKDYPEIKSSLKRLIYISKKIELNTVFIQSKKLNFKKDPIKILKKNGEIKKISDKLFQFQGNFLNVFRKTNEYFFKLAINKYKAIDQENPSLWPIDLYKKINYFNEFPQQSLLVFGLKKNHKNLKQFSLNHEKSKNFKRILPNNQFEGSEYGLQPAVCDNCYYAFKNLKIFRNSIYTTYNKVFRNETSKYKSLDRLITFSVRDIIFMGSKNFVIKTRNQLLDDIIKFLKIADIQCSIETANDPFFIGNINKKLFQNIFNLKYEILALIPFLKKKIAIGSVNLHLDTFGKAFNIRNKNKNIFSGCVGIGFERLLLALYSQHGNDLGKWPIKLKKILKL